jgi:hypothetical protein
MSKGDRRDGGLEMCSTKPLPSAWHYCIDCRPDLENGQTLRSKFTARSVTAVAVTPTGQQGRYGLS